MAEIGQLVLVELEVAVLVEFHQHGRGKHIVEAPDMGEFLHGPVRRDAEFKTRFGENMRMGKCNRRHKAGSQNCSCGYPGKPACEPW